MTPPELPLIAAAMRVCEPPIIDVGSSTLAFRTRAKLAYNLAREIGQPIICFDLQAAAGVDVIGDAERLTDYFPPATVGGIICTSLLEHVRRPWLVVDQCAAALRPRGRLVLTVPWIYPEHRDPIDCWRISLAGLRSLAADAGLREIWAVTLRQPGPIEIAAWVGTK